MRKIIILLVIATMLSGCTSVTEVDEKKVKSLSDKLTEVIIESTSKDRVERNELHTVNAENLDTLNIKSTVGDINIETTDSKDATITINIIGKSSSKEKSQELVDNFQYSVENKFKSIVIDTSYKNIQNDYQLSTELNIAVPSNIETIIIDLNVGEINIAKVNGKYEIVNNVGTIEIANSIGSYDIKTNVGEIILKDASAVDKSKFTTNTGDIVINLNDIANAKSITASTDVGDIELKVPEHSSYEAIINEFMEKEKTETSQDKTTKIELKTGVGTIDFN